MQFSIGYVRHFVVEHWKYVLGILAICLIGLYVIFGRGDSAGATLTITRGDFEKTVSVSGTVIAAHQVDLGFAANGRITGIFAKVGDRVIAGKLLAQTENGDLAAALTEARADLSALINGARPEELELRRASVKSAEDELLSAVRNAYTVADDAVHNKADMLFDVEGSYRNPQESLEIKFRTFAAATRNDAERARNTIDAVFSNWESIVVPLSAAHLPNAAIRSQEYLTEVSSLLTLVNAALHQGVADEAVSDADLDSFATTMASARSAVSAAATTLASALGEYESATKNLSLTQAGATNDDIIAQQAVVQSAQSALAKTLVVAPFAGIVTRMDAKAGEIVSPTTPLIAMQSSGAFQIETFIPEVAISGIEVGNSAMVTLDAYGSSVKFPASVVSVDPAETVNDGVPTYKTVLQFSEADERIRSGMTANVVITTGILETSIVIPEGAIERSGAESYVSVWNDGDIEKRRITTGIAPSLGQAHIVSGLEVGDVIVLTPSP
jgi:multidrug efflux pump subunit AcrA (membrane-fusion protein)